MNSLFIKNLGYLLVLVPQLLLVAGVHTGRPWLSVLFFFLLLPALRLVVGNDHAPANKNSSPLLALYFLFLPRLYFCVWMLVLPWSVWVLATHSMSAFDILGFGCSFWIVASLNTAIAHEMIHMHQGLDRTLGRLLASSVGYFHLAEEHASHHKRNGHYHDSDAAMPGTSIYRFALKRYRRSMTDARKIECGRLKRLNKHWMSNRLLHCAMIPVLIGAGFFMAASWTGILFYLFQLIATAFSVQAITYLQHWGLTEKETPELADFGFAWEDNCWMQACVTLNHAYHVKHHLRPSLPYFKLTSTQHGLQLSASYPVMFIVALFPPWLNKVMGHRLSVWRDRHSRQELQEHSNDCLGAVRKKVAAAKCEKSS